MNDMRIVEPLESPFMLQINYSGIIILINEYTGLFKFLVISIGDLSSLQKLSKTNVIKLAYSNY